MTRVPFRDPAAGVPVAGAPAAGRSRGGAGPPIRPDADADPDADGVALAAATATGVLLGTRFPLGAAWVAATLCLVVASLGVGHGAGSGAGTRSRSRAVAGLLVLGTLLAAGAAAASVRATAVTRGVLVARVGRPGRVEVAGAVAEEPRRVRYGGYWVVLTVDRVRLAGRTQRTRERAGLFLGRSQEELLGRGPGQGGRLAVGERLRVRASLAAARWSDPLGRQPRVVLRRPVIEERAPPRGGLGGALRGSEVVREAARRRALATLAPERAGLLAGMALGDTSLLPGDLERDFRAAGLTHLMAVSGANLAVVLGAGLWLAGVAGAGRRTLAVVVLLLADPALAGALGFQLSVAATAGVLWLGPPVARWLPDRIPERVGTAVGMTLGAQATAVPALALVFGRVSLAGLPANLLGLPLAGGPMLLGVVAAATAPVAPWVATLACRLADPFLVALIGVARWAAGLPGGSVTLPGPARAGPAVAVLVARLVVARRRR